MRGLRRLVLTGVMVVGLAAPSTWPPARSATAVSLKPPARGLFDRHRIPADATVRQVVNGAVIQATWAELQPDQGGSIRRRNVIDKALRQARRFNRRTAGPDLQLKLRVYAGVNAPEWAKNLDGPPVPLSDPQTGEFIGTVPRFWTPSFKAAYDDLMAQLAARYDREPLLVDVAISRCTTQFAEPFLRQGGLAANRSAYLAAGYSLAADHQCHTEQIETAARTWLLTRSSLALSPYDAIASATEEYTDEAFTESMMGYCRQVLGVRCVLGNNSLSWPLGGPAYVAMYERITALGPPIYFQTATLQKIGDWRAALDWAVTHGANMVELPFGYQANMPLPELASYDARLEANFSP